jgi:hypothetical protein
LPISGGRLASDASGDQPKNATQHPSQLQHKSQEPLETGSPGGSAENTKIGKRTPISELRAPSSWQLATGATQDTTRHHRRATHVHCGALIVDKD